MHSLTTQLPVVVVKAMLALLKRVRAGKHRPAAAHASTARIVIMEHPATDYKPSNPK